MSYTPYDDSIPLAKDALNSVKTILKIAEKHPNAANLPAARLHPDMKPLTFQVEIVARASVRLLGRLSGQEDLCLEGELTTFADMYERIEKAQAMLANADIDLINGRINDKIMIDIGREQKSPFSGYALTFGYSIPSILFHVSTAYGILRKEGVPIGKSDYIDSFGSRFEPE